MGRHNFKKLKIWQEGITLVGESYSLTRRFPDFEKFENKILQIQKMIGSFMDNLDDKSLNSRFYISSLSFSK